MKKASFIAVCTSFFALATSALADESLTIPSVAFDPAPSPSVWSGFYVGTGVNAVAAKGHKGGFGGDVFMGYDKTFDNHLVLGLKLDTGYLPVLSGHGGGRGFDYAMSSVKLGYDFGRVTPYVYAGAGIAHATAFDSPLPDAGRTLNGAFSGLSGARAATELGAGVDYHVTNNLTVGVSAGVVNGPTGGF